MAQAEDHSRLRLTWDAPAECPNSREVQRQIDSERRDLEATEASDDPIEVRATVEKLSDARWGVTLETLQGGVAGQRRLEGTSCEALAQSAALILAMMLRPASPSPAAPSPLAPSPATPSPLAPSPATPSPLAPSPATPPPLAPSPSAPSAAGDGEAPVERAVPDLDSAATTAAGTMTTQRVQALATAHLGIESGSLPGAAAVAGVAVGVKFGGLRAQIGGAWWTPSDQQMLGTSNPSAGASVSLIAGRASACLELWRSSRLACGPCLGLELGVISAETIGEISHPGGRSFRWVAPTLSALGTVDLLRDRLAVRWEAGAAVATSRPVFWIEPLGAAHQPGYVSARTDLGLEVYFP